ncbi:hypothetical protein UY3_08882 [Chelonia mydas]|uniref:RING-type E3 ubiquitin transferase n=1 Tax=Chelonia mydas TaxID=8469 RepID=M7C0S5_CHEMY|nr:hypothetical protein UY3_08882 [Chelonia mydas]
MTSRGAGTAFSRRNYRLSTESEKPKLTGIVNSKLLNDYLHRVFPSADGIQPATAYRKPLTFQNLQEHLDKLLAEDSGAEDSRDQVLEGRLGPSTVVLDHTSGFEGLLLVDDDLLGVIGHSNFGSIRATTCVYKGKWIYEVLISSQGLMQIGWCTLNCRFNQEEGVGDTPDSYAYDGNRVRKWNVTTTNYGKSWAAGDIVSCLIDLDEGTIAFCLNGVSLGTAFDNITRGAGMAYFPAISLSFKESVAFNFGSRPLRYTYPVEGYRPLQDPPSVDLVKAHKLLGYLKNVIHIGIDVLSSSSSPTMPDTDRSDHDCELHCPGVTETGRLPTTSLKPCEFLKCLFLIIWLDKHTEQLSIVCNCLAHHAGYVLQTLRIGVDELLDLLGLWGEEALQAQLRTSNRNLDIHEQIVWRMQEKGTFLLVSDNAWYSSVLQQYAFSLSAPSASCSQLLTRTPQTEEGKLVEKDTSTWQLQGEPTVLITLTHIFNHFAPLMCKVYLVVLLRILERGGAVEAHPLIQQLLDLMWLLMEDYEVHECLKQLLMSLLRAYRFSPIIPDLGLQIHYLRLTIAVLKHEKSRKYLLNNVLFDVLRSVVFFYIKSPLRVEEAGLQELIPTTWWPNRFTKEGKESKEVKEESAEERLRRRAYDRGCQRLKKRIEVVEELQVQILKLLLSNKDRGGGEASRYIFLNKFRRFLQENASNRGNLTVLCPPEYMVCFLHRLISTLRCYWDGHKAKAPAALSSEEAYVPPQLFYNGKVDYFDLQRLGGLLSHLKKTLKDDLALKANILIDPAELQAVTMDDLDEDEESATSTAQRPVAALAIGGALARPSWLSSPTLGRANRFLSTAAVSLMNPRRPLGTLEKMKARTLSVEQRTEDDIEGSHGNEGLLLGRPPEEPEQSITENSLLEILDGIVMMYNLSVHQQLGKMVGVSDDVNEYALALKDTEEKISRCPKRRRDIYEELVKSQKVFSEKLNHLSRRLAWINVTIYSKEKMQDIYWLLRVCIRTIEHGDRTGSLFAFMPEFYLSVAMNSYSALKNYFSPVHSMEELPGYEETLTRLAAILAKHFADSRIVGTDIRDSLMQALASYVCYPHSLRAVERIPEEQRISMMRNLLAPYEQRPWAQTNWILVRLWRGCGFGYRYTRLPHLLKTKPEDANLPSLQKPCPSTLLQQHMADLLRSDCDMAPSFLNSVLNQLNWAFSEFVGMIQEIQQAAERLERNFVDSRQLKVCATCFDLSVSLLRVLEMTVTLAPEIFLDWSRPSSELLLRRLAQLLNQVLNRVTAERNLFDRVVNLRLPGLESVDHYPILVAVTGILVRLLMDTDFQGSKDRYRLVWSAILDLTLCGILLAPDHWTPQI